jgi:hypothetical protein
MNPVRLRRNTLIVLNAQKNATLKKFLRVSAFLAGTMFFLIGMLKSLALAKHVFLSGIWTLLTGGAAA